jgi:hypothetical protein
MPSRVLNRLALASTRPVRSSRVAGLQLLISRVAVNGSKIGTGKLARLVTGSANLALHDVLERGQVGGHGGGIATDIGLVTWPIGESAGDHGFIRDAGLLR